MKKKTACLLLFLATVTGVAVVSCTSKRDVIPAATDCSVINAKFAADVNPIIQSTCANNSGCHGAGSVNGPGPLLTYTQISAAAADIKAAVVSRLMPLGSTLSDDKIKKIMCWVDSGAQNN